MPGNGRMAPMKQTLAGLALVSLTILTSMAFSRPSAQSPSSSPGAARTAVVVELFTSEGCSSCPPADALLARLTEQQFYENAQLITLEEHVDYWDGHGWVDPFSSRDCTPRQNVYAGVLANRNPYTPQMVVAGTVEFTGSNVKKDRQEIL